MAEAFKFPALPRLFLGELVILPLVDVCNDPVPGRWVLPGCQVITTHRAEQIAREKNLYFHILHRR